MQRNVQPRRAHNVVVGEAGVAAQRQHGQHRGAVYPAVLGPTPLRAGRRAQGGGRAFQALSICRCPGCSFMLSHSHDSVACY